MHALSLCVWMSSFVLLCTCTSVYLCVCVCARVRVHACTCGAHARARAPVSLSVCVCVGVSIHIYTHTYICLCMHVYVSIYLSLHPSVYDLRPVTGRHASNQRRILSLVALTTCVRLPRSGASDPSPVTLLQAAGPFSIIFLITAGRGSGITALS